MMKFFLLFLHKIFEGHSFTSMAQYPYHRTQADISDAFLT